MKEPRRKIRPGAVTVLPNAVVGRVDQLRDEEGQRLLRVTQRHDIAADGALEVFRGWASG